MFGPETSKFRFKKNQTQVQAMSKINTEARRDSFCITSKFLLGLINIFHQMKVMKIVIITVINRVDKYLAD